LNPIGQGLSYLLSLSAIRYVEKRTNLGNERQSDCNSSSIKLTDWINDYTRHLPFLWGNDRKKPLSGELKANLMQTLTQIKRKTQETEHSFF
jgi:hypothetical protein